MVIPPWLRPVLAAAAVALLLVVGVPLPAAQQPSSDATTPGHPTLPAALAGYSLLTGSVTDSPSGRAAAVFQYAGETLLQPSQVVVVSADGNRYRYVEQAQPSIREERNPVLLSGDGTRLAVGSGSRGVSDIPVVDLRTGQVTRFPIDADSTVSLLAWSADGRWLAYATRPFRPLPESYGESMRARGGRLVVLDLTTGHALPMTGPKIPASVAQAAFSPDGTLLAIQAGGVGAEEIQQLPPGREVLLVGATPEKADPWAGTVTEIAVPENYELPGQAAWSPDDGRLALIASRRLEAPEVWLHTLQRNGSDWTDGPQVDVRTLSGAFLGWQSPYRVVVWADQAVISANLGGSVRETLSRTDTASTASVGVADLQLAFALLPDLNSRPNQPVDRGPWPPWLRTGVAVVVLLVAALVVSLVLQSRRRRRLALRAALAGPVSSTEDTP